MPVKTRIPSRETEVVLLPVVLHIGIFPVLVNLFPRIVAMGFERSFVDLFIEGLKTLVAREADEVAVLAAQGAMDRVAGKSQDVA